VCYACRMGYAFRPIDEAAARAIVAWRYAAAHARYDVPEAGAVHAVEQMLRPELRFHVFEREGRVGGFCSFGEDGQVPGGDAFYDTSATDVGAGLAPELTGQGRGAEFLAAVVRFGRSSLVLGDLRASIASWNGRALRAAEGAGFVAVGGFRNTSGVDFTLLVNASHPQRL